jgi:hypothetical protein
MGETSAPYPHHSSERLLPELRVVDGAFPLAGSATLAANLERAAVPARSRRNQQAIVVFWPPRRRRTAPMMSATNLGLKTGARRAALSRFPHSATPVVCAVSCADAPDPAW